jgi:uncharacterized protein (TIGR02246 family)
MLAVLALAAGLGTIAVAQEADEEAIKQLGASWKEAWNGRNADALAELYTADADLIDVMGKASSGREEVRAQFLEGWEQMGEAAQMDFEQTNLRFITPDLAVEDGTWQIAGIPDAEEAPPSKGLYTAYLVKQDGQWLITGERDRVPMAPPSAEE